MRMIPKMDMCPNLMAMWPNMVAMCPKTSMMAMCPSMHGYVPIYAYLMNDMNDMNMICYE